MSRVTGLIKKEIYQIVRDPSSILIAFVLPAILIFIFGYAVSLDVRELKIGLMLEDTNPTVNHLAESFFNSTYFNVTVARDRREVESKLLAGDLRGIVVVPFYFGRKLTATPNPVPIQVIADASETNTADLFQNYVRGVWSIWLQQRLLQTGQDFKPPIQIAQRIWYNPAGISRYFLLPGSIAIIMTIIGTLMTALVLGREWERGTMEAMMATPITIWEILLGKIIPYFLMGLGSMLICVLLSVYAFQIPLRGSLWLLFTVSAIFLGTALSMGLLISTVARNQFLASQLSLYTAYLPAFMLSGFIFEISSMPLIIQAITYIMPARYFVNNLQTLFLAGDIYPLIITNSIAIIFIGTVLLYFVYRRTRKRLD